MAFPTAVNAQITDAAPAVKPSVPIGANPGDPVVSPQGPEQAALDEPSKDAPEA